MRIIQLIDSLEAGGAERMAVNYANELSYKIDFSGLVVSRSEGQLFNQLHEKVDYLFLNKKRIIDIKSIKKFLTYVKKSNIDVIHAHSTSFFLAFLIKIFHPSIKLIWHDHYGDSEFLNKRPTFVLKVVIPFFYGVISVNNKLKKWAHDKLKIKNVVYLPNFPVDEIENNYKTILKGIYGKRIVCLANLRPQKNHFLLVKIAQKLKISNPDWTFHLVGKDFEDQYSQEIKNLIVSFELNENVFIYNSKQDIKNILSQSEIAILTSSSEGLPLALLEYGLNNKPVVVTNVGEISAIITNNINGFIVASNDEISFYENILKLINNESLRKNMGDNLFELIQSTYSEKSIINQYLNWIINSKNNSVLKN